MTYLKKLSSVGLPDLVNLDHDSQIEEIVQRIKNDPDWNAIWDGELTQNASYAVINYFAYLHAKAAEATNRTLRENFITQARDANSIVDHLSDYGLSLQQNRAAVVTVTGTIAAGALTQNLTIPVATKIPGLSLNSNEIIFEIIKKDITQPDKWDYEADTTITAGVDAFEVEAYAGETFVLDTILNPPQDVEKFTYTIPIPNIIDNSIRVYYEYNNILLKTELLESKTFVVPQVVTPTFPNGIPHFKIKYFPDGTAQIIFGTETFGGAFPTGGPSNIRIFGRSGGGRESNVSTRALKASIQYQLNLNNVTTVNFTNLVNGVGGADRENIFEAQFYAPHRIGRNSSIVSDDDVLNEFSSKVVKHRVDSPKYSELGNNIPILHYHNYVVPKRDFINFIFPSVSINDTTISYTQRFLKELNVFLNLRKIHDQLLEDEIVGFFTASDFSYILEYNPPLNGSLFLSAYDHEDLEVDRLKFTNNYSGAFNSPDAPADVAQLQTNASFTPVTVTTGFNDQFKFAIDEEDPLNPGTGAGLVHTITINPGLYGTAEILAAEIDSKIHAIHSYFSANPTYTYCLIVDNKIVIRSKITGQYSRVELQTVSNSIYATINISVPAVSRALPTSGLVFKSNSNYNLTLNQVDVKLNADRFSQDFDVNAGLTGWPDINSATGPSINHTLVEENNVTQAYAQIGTTIVVQALHSISNALLDELTFTSVTDNPINTGVITGSGNVFDSGFPSNLNFDYPNSLIHMKLLDSIAGGPPYTFPPGYDQNLKFNIVYQKKTYKFITATYYPNPYYNEDETAEYAAILKGKDKKQLCVEPIMKRIEFVPVKVQASVTAKKSKSPTKAILDTKALIDDRFGYANIDLENNIGTGFSSKKLNATLNETVVLNPNTQNVNLLQPSSDITDATANKNQYYFVMPDDLIESMILLENQNSNITGFTDQFRVVLTVE